MACQVLNLHPRPTALFAANNFIAFGAIRALREVGLRIPEAISLVAFDDLPDDWLIDPFLTVVDQRAYEMGKQAAELILERIAGVGRPMRRSIIVPVDFIVRRSSAPPPSDLNVTPRLAVDTALTLERRSAADPRRVKATPASADVSTTRD
jgi:LacI family transcriptional regulator